MPDYCTCGAALPDEALFCHKCGKPQRPELITPVTEEPEEQLPPISATVREHTMLPERIDFSDPLAVRIGLFVGCVTGVLTNFLPIACPLWLFGAGFAAVYLYGRRKQLILPGKQAMQIGWLTGLFTFTVAMIFFVIGMFVLINAGQLSAEQKAALRQMPIFGGDAERALDVLKSPTTLAVSLVVSLLFLFIVCTVLPIIGAAVAARVQARD